MNRNPHNFCTLDSDADCGNCANQSRLHCKWDARKLLGFFAISFPYCILAFLGLALAGVVTGAWWPLIAYAVYFLFFFALPVPLICRHCPFYAEDSFILHCLANNGLPKLFGYRPGPIGGMEKLVIGICLFIFLTFPFAVQCYSVWCIAYSYDAFGEAALLGAAGIALGTLLGAITFITALKFFFCPCCVNFSCPLNSVPKAVVDEYLGRNPVMREAWEKSGYKMDDADSEEVTRDE
jgi:hypothetical protein